MNGVNVFAYCRNNPIMQVDPSGHIPIANYITKIQFTKLIGGFDSFWWGRVNYSVTKLIEQYPEEIGIFLCAHDL